MTKPRTCLVCHDLPEMNGSLTGKFADSVVERLVKQEKIDVLVTNLEQNSINNESQLRENICLKFLSEQYIPNIYGHDAVAVASKVYKYIHDAEYDSVHLILPGGAGAYCAMAKSQKIIESRIITYVIDGSEVKRKIENRFPEREDFLVEALERAQCEYSDVIVSIDNSLPPEIVSTKRRFGQLRYRRFWPTGFDKSSIAPLATKSMPKESIDNLVILGNHGYASGIDLIIRAMNRLPDDIHPSLTFIGDFGEIFGENSGGYIIRHLAEYRGRLSFLSPRDDRKVFQALHQPNSLTIIPGRGRDGSWELAQIFSTESPFLAFGIEGMGDHIAVESVPFCTMEANPDSIVDAILNAVADGMPQIRAAYSPGDIENDWQTLLAEKRPAYALTESRPMVSVCLTHYERPALLRQALDGLARQTYDNVEVILIDDGSKSVGASELLDDLEAQEYRFPLKIIRSKNCYLGAARNIAAEQAKGEYLLFHDDDNIAEPYEIEMFVRAAVQSDADILTSFYWVFENIGEGGPIDRRLLCNAVGIGGPISLLENRFGDANALVRRSVFHEIGGFSPLYGVGYEDWEFFLKAYLRGYRLGVVPEPLFNYRVSGDSMVASSSHGAGLERVFRLLDDERCAFSGDLARLIASESAAYQARTRLSTELECSEAKSLHLRLAELPPNSHEVWKLLSEIALIEGRADDPAKLAVGSSPPRDAPGATGTVHAQAVHDAGRPAVILTGWGISGNGEAISPSHFCLQGHVYEVCAIARQPRLDVNERFKIPHSIPAGFCIAGRLVKGPKSYLFRFGGGQKIGSPKGKIRIFGRGGDGMVAHIDQCFIAREAEIEIPLDWTGKLTLETMRPSFPFARYGKFEYRLGRQKSQFRTEFSFACDRQLASSISIIAPLTPKADIFLETRRSLEKNASEPASYLE